MEPFTHCYLYFLSYWHDFFQITQYLILKVITRILNTLLFVYRSPPFSGRLSQGSLQGHLRWDTNTSDKPELSNCSTVFDKWIKQAHLKSLTQDPRRNITDLLISFLVKKILPHLDFFFCGRAAVSCEEGAELKGHIFATTTRVKLFDICMF